MTDLERAPSSSPQSVHASGVPSEQTPLKPSGDIGKRNETVGGITWHSSDPDSGPDVGISIYLSPDEWLWLGEITRKSFDDNNGGAHFDGDIGWFILRYKGADTQLIAKCADEHEGREFMEQVASWIRSANESAAEIERLRRELDAANSNHRAMAYQLAETSIRLEHAESAVAGAWEEAAILKLLFSIPTHIGLADAHGSERTATSFRNERASAIRAACSEKTVQSNHSPSTLNAESE